MRAEGPTKETASALNGSSVDDQADDQADDVPWGKTDSSRMVPSTTPKNAPRDRGPTYEFSLGSVDTFERKLELAQARLQVSVRALLFLPTYLPTPSHPSPLTRSLCLSVFLHLFRVQKNEDRQQ